MKVWGFFMLCWIHNCKCHHFFVYCGMNNKYQKYIEYIVNDIQVPYFKSLEQYGLKQEEMDLVLSKVINQPVKFVVNRVFDKDNNELYYERSDGYWIKTTFDDEGNEINFYDSDGYCQHYIDKQYVE